MFGSIGGQYDILVTTTIIETGVDIPSVNTLSIKNAGYMGLSMLCQLRGCVGRSSRAACAYSMYEQQRAPNEVSEKRLEAIKDFTELSSEFKTTIHDLSIRGAGNLLDAQQHGFIDSVGFDMYSQTLSEAIAHGQGKNIQDQKVSVETDLGIDAYIPGTYIIDERQKIEIYKRIRQPENVDMYEELEADLLDRSGEYPNKVAHLLTTGRIRMDDDRVLSESIRKHDQKVELVLSKIGAETYSVEQLFEALSVTSLKADLAVEREQMTISLKLPKNCKEAIWTQKVAAFTTALRQEKHKHSQGADSL